MAISVHNRGDRIRSSHQWGGVMFATPIMFVATLMLFGLAYDGYRVYRENIEQDRLARSIGVVALKAYRTAGCDYDRDGDNAGRVKFALNAAMNTVDIKDISANSIPAISLPSSGPVEVVFEDTSGPSLGKVVVRLGSLSSSDDTSLEGLNPCSIEPVTGLTLSPSAVDNWEAGQPFQSGLIPSDFDWKQYLASNLDLVRANIDTEIESKRHFAKYGLNEGRSGYVLKRQEAHQFIGADVKVFGLSSTRRSGGFARLFGVQTLGRSNSPVLAVLDISKPEPQYAPAQPLQIAEIEIGTNPPAFRKPVIDPSKVSYTMSMDVMIERTGSSWRNIFNSGDLDCCDATTRRPALFISGNDSGRPNVIHLVHGTSAGYDPSFGTGDYNGNNRYVMTSFAATPGVYFNITWTVDNGRLTTYINGVPDSTGSTTGGFNWAEQNWRWNAYLTQWPTRPQNTEGSVKVKNVYWWNRSLAASEVRPLQVSEIEIGTNPPVFKKPVIDRSKVSYTMSMDVTIERTASSWRNILNSSIKDCCDETTRRPAVFITGNEQGPANRIVLVHGQTSPGDNNKHVITSFAATPGVPFNLTWTVDNGRLTTYVNGVPDPTGSTIGGFNWAEENWSWNSYLTQLPNRTQNTEGSVKVKNVNWWNRPLAPGEIAQLSSVLSSSGGATLSQHCVSDPIYEKGWIVAVQPGRYPNIAALGVPQKHLSSLRVQKGMRVTLYEDLDFLGKSVTLTGDTPCLLSMDFNDATSSIVVEKDGAEPVLYRFVEPAQ